MLSDFLGKVQILALPWVLFSSLLLPSFFSAGKLWDRTNVRNSHDGRLASVDPVTRDLLTHQTPSWLSFPFKSGCRRDSSGIKSAYCSFKGPELTAPHWTAHNHLRLHLKEMRRALLVCEGTTVTCTHLHTETYSIHNWKWNNTSLRKVELLFWYFEMESYYTVQPGLDFFVLLPQRDGIIDVTFKEI